MKKFDRAALAAHEPQAQYGALCYREAAGGIEILLVTSRDTGRWVIPKGWPQARRNPAETALCEAFEEGGVDGSVSSAPVGIYAYSKALANGAEVPCRVSVFAIRAERMHVRFPERHERRRAWFPPVEAAELVQEPDLRRLIRSFDPGHAAPASARP
ncbi:MAG: NUDIX hydrolase [Paracoccaceae bacterium]